MDLQQFVDSQKKNPEPEKSKSLEDLANDIEKLYCNIMFDEDVPQGLSKTAEQYYILATTALKQAESYMKLVNINRHTKNLTSDV